MSIPVRREMRRALPEEYWLSPNCFGSMVVGRPQPVPLCGATGIGEMQVLASMRRRAWERVRPERRVRVKRRRRGQGIGDFIFGVLGLGVEWEGGERCLLCSLPPL